MPDKVKVLYDALSGEYDLGAFEDFKSKMSDQTKRRTLYDAVGKSYDLGTFEEFESKIAPSGPVPAAKSMPKGGLPSLKQQIEYMTPLASEEVKPSKYQQAVNKDKSEIGKTLSTLYNGIIGSFETLTKFATELPASFPITPYQFSPVDIGKAAESARAFRETPLQERLKTAKEGRKGIEEAFDIARSGYTTRQEEQALKGQFNVMDGIGLKDMQALIGMSGGLATDMALGAATGGATFVAQGVQNSFEDFDAAAEKSGYAIDPAARNLYGLAGGIINGVLEKFAVDKIVGDVPVFRNLQRKVIANVLKNTANVTGKRAVDAIEEAAVAEIKALTNNFKRAGYRALVEGGTEGAQAALEDGAKFAANAVQGNEVFNEEEIAKGFISNVVNSAVAGGIFGPVLGAGADVAFGKNVNTELLKDIANAKTAEELDAIRQELTKTFDENNFSEEEREIIMNNANRYAQIKQTIPEGTPALSQAVAIPKIEQRMKLDDEINKKTEYINTVDEALKASEEQELSFLQDRRASLNDEIREIVSNDTFTYTEENGKYYKSLEGGAKEEISKNRYDLEQIKRGNYATTKSGEQIQEGRPEGDIGQRQGAQEVQDQETFKADIGYRYIVGEEGDDIPITALLNKKVRVKGQPAILYQQGQTVEARIIGTNRIIEIGNVNKLMNELPDSYDIELDEVLVTETPQGYRIEGQPLQNINENPLDAISLDQNGNVMNVVLTTPAGKRRKFRGQVAQDLAYQIQLKEILKDEEQFEEFLAREHQAELDAAAQIAAQQEPEQVQEPTEEQAAPAIERISPRQVEPTYGRVTDRDATTSVRLPNPNRIQRKVLNDAKKVATALEIFIPRTTGQAVQISLHDANSFEEAVVAAGGTQQDATSRGFYMSTDGSIHLNMDNLETDTVLHEGFHPVLDFVEAINPAKINDFYNKLASIPGAEAIIDKAKELYGEGDAHKKEAITDFVAAVADGRVVVNPSNFQKIKAFILNLVKSLGIGSGQKILTVKDETGLVALSKYITEQFTSEDGLVTTTDVANIVSEKEADRELAEIEEDLVGEKQYDSSEGQDVDKTIPEKGSGRGPQFSRSTLENAKNNLKKVSDLAGTKIARVVFYDMTRVGKLDIKNIKTGYTPDIEGKGGPLYSYMDNSIQNKSVLAFVSINQAIQSLQRQQMFPEAVHAVASQNPMTAHLGNKSTLQALFGEGIGIFQNAAKTKAQEKEIVNILVSEIDRMSKMPPNIEASKSVNKILQKVNLSSIKTINDFRDKILLGEGDSFGKRGSIMAELLQGKQSKVTASTRNSHKILHYKYGIPTIEDIAKGNNQSELSNIELGDVVKLVRPSIEPVIYTTDSAMFERYSNNPTPEMKKGGIRIELLPEESAHESYPFVLVGENVALLEEYIGAQQLYQNFKDIKKSATFFKVGRMKKEAEAGKVPVSVITEQKGPQFQRQYADVVNGFYSPIVKKVNEFKQPNASATKWKEIVGFKTDEAVYSGLADWLNSKKPNEQVSKEDVLKFMKDNRLQITEKTRGGDYKVFDMRTDREVDSFETLDEAQDFVASAREDGDRYGIEEPIGGFISSIYEDYQLFGGKDYKERLVILPGKDIFKGNHFLNDSNILVHLRMNTRTDADGKKVLFLEEVQSDWGQKGKREGFTSSETQNTLKQLQDAVSVAAKNLSDIESELDRQYELKKNDGESRSQLRLRDKEFDKLAKEYAPAEQKEFEARKAFNEFQINNRTDIPKAPFVTDTNAWVKLGLKIALKEAVKEGADRIAWTTGEQQNERYDLSKSIKRVDFIRIGDNRYKFEALGLDGKIIAYDDNGTTSLQEIEDMFGKDIAEKVKADKAGDLRLQGDGLKVGGKGMIAFYGDAQNIGIVGKVAKAVVKELTGKEGAIVESKIPSGIQPAIDITPELKQSVKAGMPQFQKAPTEALAKKGIVGITKLAAKEYAGYGVLGKEGIILREKKAGELSAELATAEKYAKDAILLTKKYKNSVSKDDVIDFMTGQPVQGNLPADLAAALSNARQHVDNLTERLIQLGVIDDQETIDYYRDNKGKYLLRSYEAIDYNEKFGISQSLYGKGLNIDNVAKKLNNVDKTVVDAALKFLADRARAQNPSLSEADAMKQARIEANGLLSNAEEYVMQRGLTGSTNIASIGKRLSDEELSPELRALMGEYTDPIYNYYASIFKIASLTSSRQYLNSMKDYGMGKFIFPYKTEDATVQIAGEGSKGLEPLNGMYTFPEIYEALKKAENDKPLLITQLAGRVRKFKTVYNPATHIKNVIGNTGFAISNGHWNYIPEAYKYMRASIVGGDDKDVMRMMDTLNRYGVLNNTLGIGELKQYFKRNENVDDFLTDIYKAGGKNKAMVGKVAGAAKDVVTRQIPKFIEKAYQIEDDLFKILGFVNESNRYAKAKYQKAYDKLSEEEKKDIDGIASEIVKDTYPTFTRVPKGVKVLSKALFLGNFLSFPVESVRVQYNALALARKEILSGNPRLKTVGLSRIAGAVAYNSLLSSMVYYGFSLAGAGLTGMLGVMNGDDEEETENSKAIQRYVAPWNKNTDKYPTSFSNGKLIYYDIGSLDSYNYQKRVWNAFWSNLNNKEGFNKAISQSMSEALDPWLQRDFVLDNFNKLMTNPNNSIYNPKDEPWKQWQDKSMFVAKQMGPGFVGASIKIADSYTKGDYEKAINEAYSQIVRRYDVDLEKQFRTFIYVDNTNKNSDIGFKDALRNTENIYTRAKDAGVKGIELNDSYREAVDKYKEQIKIIKDYYDSAIRGGVPAKKLNEIMSKSGFSPAVKKGVMEGKFNLPDNSYIKK
jgi:hypothetical protein